MMNYKEFLVLYLCKYGIVCVCVRFQFSGGRDTIPFLLKKNLRAEKGDLIIQGSRVSCLSVSL